ncbi:MAG: dihydroneopterin aldolase [Gemmatimonadota bacterium]|nr:dihydroneopterin aldolase [Gemmatimonadota bacterium]
MAPSESVSLRGMRFHVLVGVLPHEQTHPQPLEVDVTVWRAVRPGDGAAGTGEGDVVDYRDLYAVVAARVTAGPLRFLEDVARTLVGDLLARPHVRRARVAVRKPHVPLPGPLSYAEVVVDSGHPGPDA